jgi:septum site-determining protein MinC
MSVDTAEATELDLGLETAPFQLRGQSMTLMVLKLFNPADPSFFDQLSAKVGQAPNFFRHAPVVLDLTDAPGASVDFRILIPGLRKLGLLPVGIQGGPVDVQSAAVNAGLGVFRAARNEKTKQTSLDLPPDAPAPAQPQTPVAQEEPLDENVPGGLTVSEPVRSGRQVYAPRGDLVVTAPVSAGAELLADGNIHVYGTLRGRALAGLSGDMNARIFCQSLEAELVSIAGLYRVAEDIEPGLRGRPVQVYREDNFLRIKPLNADK